MDLAKIDTTLTRRQADSLYEKAYQYRILSDMSVRREWVDEQHRLLLDFEIAKDSLLMAEVHYTTPVDIESAVEDAKTLNGGNLSKWQRAKDEQAKSIGLGSCYYSRTKDNRFFFIEADKNKKASCMIYFASSPRVNRRALEEANTESFTAMGTNATADAAKVLSEDEEARLLAFLKRTHQSRIVDTTTSTPSVAVAPRAGSSKVNVGPVASTTPAASPTQDTVAAADQPEAAEAEATKAGKTLGFNITEEQMYYILGGVIALIILIMMLKPKAPAAQKANPSGCSRIPR